MVRTQIYLTEQEQAQLRSLSRRTGRKRSELIRDAIDRFLSHVPSQPQLTRMRRSRGIWKDRELSEFQMVRDELSRRTSG